MSDSPLRCPETACTGWVVEVCDGDEHFWGCGECGTTWFDRCELDESIRAAVTKYPYRKKCYRKSKQGWNPAPVRNEPKGYEDLVEQEGGEVAADPAEVNYACPVSKCCGTALYMEDESNDGGDPAHWLCDCCGSTWLDKENLMQEIGAIIDRYPHRAARYQKVGKGWKPVEWVGDIMDYDDLVEKEARDRKTGRRRG
jgi:hypothetical protein